MAIVNMESELLRIPEHAVNIKEITGSYGEMKNRLFTYETHVGLCIEEREMNGYDDSDFYMLVWNEETNRPNEYLFASTRGWTYPCYASKPDATPEVMAKYNAYRAKVEEEHRAAKREAARRDPTFGKPVKVVRGRKVPIGTKGEVFWRGASKFGERVGIRLADNSRVFTALTNVEVVL